MRPGVALNPHTPLAAIEEVMSDLDLVCLMSVNPGFGGQKFIPTTFEKVRKLNAMRQAANADFLIEIDGGVGAGNAAQLVEAGADVLVAGSSVFGAPDPLEAVAKLKSLTALSA